MCSSWYNNCVTQQHERCNNESNAFRGFINAYFWYKLQIFLTFGAESDGGDSKGVRIVAARTYFNTNVEFCRDPHLFGDYKDIILVFAVIIPSLRFSNKRKSSIVLWSSRL